MEGREETAQGPPGLEGIGPKLRAVRTERGLSLRALAAKVEVTPSLISQIESGKSNPSVSSLFALAAALEVPLDYFLPGGAPVIRGNQAHLPSTAEVFDQLGARPREVRVDAGSGASDAGNPVVRRDERPQILIDGFGGSITWDRLAPRPEAGAGFLNSMDFLVITYEPGAASAKNMIQHMGFETGYVLEGNFTVYIQFQEFALGPGDSIAFESSRPHRVVNTGATMGRAIWVVVR